MPPDARAHYAIQDRPLSDAPFAVGDPVVARRQPQDGSLIVQAVEPYPDGIGWAVTAGRDGYQTIAPTEHFTRCPEGFCEPPAIPTVIVLTNEGRYEPVPDPEAMPIWEEQMLAWLSKWGGR